LVDSVPGAHWNYGVRQPLPLLLQSMIAEPVLCPIDKVAENGHPGVQQLATYFVGRGVGLMNKVKPARGRAGPHRGLPDRRRAAVSILGAVGLYEGAPGRGITGTSGVPIRPASQGSADLKTSTALGNPWRPGWGTTAHSIP
jgi:hypothetical protein